MRVTARVVYNLSKRLPFQYVSLVAGLGLAVGAAVSAGALQSNESLGADANKPEPPPNILAEARPPDSNVATVIFYIVDSQFSASQMADAASQDEMLALEASIQLPRVTRIFFVAGSPDDQSKIDAQLSFISWDLWQSGTNLSVIDLRRRSKGEA